MISNQLIIDTLIKIKEISNIEFKLLSLEGTMISINAVWQGDEKKNVLKYLNDMDEVQEIEGQLYFKVFNGNHLDYLLVSDDTPEARVIGRMAAMQMESLLIIYQERYDKENFIKNLLLDNLLLVDIYNRAKKLDIDIHARRIAYLIETKNKDDENALEVIRTMFSENEDDFVSSLDENNIIVVKKLKETDTDEDIRLIAQTMSDMLNTEVMSVVRIAYGNDVTEIRKVANSYKEAKLALSVGKIFNSEQHVIAYSSLGIGRLIYQLPLPMCRMFIEEIFKEQSPEEFDAETLETINKFFENSLNVSETSRQLYIHRNTLVYRLDKIQKNTGLDLRVFDDAITFKIALMVVEYMHYMDKQEK